MTHRPISTDPHWRPDQGGLPESTRLTRDGLDEPPVLATVAWPSRTAGNSPAETGSTVTMPAREPSQHERLLAFVRDALAMADQGVPEFQALGIQHGFLIESADPEEPPAVVDWLKSPPTIMPDSPPYAEPLSPYARMKLEAAMKAMEEAIEEMRRVTP